jgi:Sec7-like guanine-nucleotide exchange factor
MEKILVPNLTKLQKDAAGRYGNPAVKQACDDALATLATLNGNADGAFFALQAACQSKVPKLAVTALDCTEKLMARGFLANTPESNAKVVRVVATCSEIMNDDVQLQVVKALLMAVSNRALPTHEASLLASIRACYHIHLVSPSPINKATSKLALSQMMTCVFSDWEDLPGQQPPKQPRQISSSSSSNNNTQVIMSSNTIPAVSLSPPPPPQQQQPPSSLTDNNNNILGEGMYPAIYIYLGFVSTSKLSSQTKQPSTTNKSSSNTNQTLLEATTTTATTETNNTNNNNNSTTDSALLRNFIFTSIAEKDAFLVMRTLSRLAMKAMSFSDVTETGEEGIADPMAVKSKLISLELLLAILESAGPKFKTSDVIIYALKQYLVPALMKNCMELNSQVSQLSMTIFVAMQRRFKDQLKKEVEVFYADVFLGLLESPNAQIESRLAVLETLSKMCGDVHQLVEIFLNYDCDLKSKDLLADIVKSLSRTACYGLPSIITINNTIGNKSSAMIVQIQQVPSSSLLSRNAEDNRRLRGGAIHCLSLLTKSLVQYNDAMPSEDNSIQVIANSIIAPANSTHTPATTDDNTTTIIIDPTLAEKIRLASAALDSFQQKQTWRKDLEIAVSKFNVKPKTGIAYLIERGHLEDSSKSIAKFLLDYQDVLSKKMIGEYLGENDEKNIDILCAYTDMVHFKGLIFDEAIRVFLKGFRIPGEAQKIDRIMEKFASRYWNQNQDALPSADTAFILAYAIIMLHTDAHNPNIKPEKKMSKASFLKNNRGIAAGRDLSPEFLGGIYDRITTRAIVLKDDVDYKDDAQNNTSSGNNTSSSSSNSTSGNTLDPKSKRKAFLKERAEILNDAESKRQLQQQQQEFITTNNHVQGNTNGTTTSTSTTTIGDDQSSMDNTPFYMVESSFNNRRHVAPMFNLIWLPTATAFTANFIVEASMYGINTIINSDGISVPSGDLNLTNKCVNGIVDSIKIATVFEMDNERDTLLAILSSLTGLNTPWEMKLPHFNAIKSLLVLVSCQRERNLFKTGWALLLQCISEVMRLLLMSKDGIDDGVTAIVPTLSSHSNSGIPPSPRSSSSNMGIISMGNILSTHSNGTISTSTGSSVPPPSPNTTTTTTTTPMNNNKRYLLELRRKAIIQVSTSLRNVLDRATVERMFIDSHKLSDDAIVYFCNALIAVSRVELLLPPIVVVVGTSTMTNEATTNTTTNGSNAATMLHESFPTLNASQSTSPRIFSLQKVVEVADFNMGTRSRLVWGKMWAGMSEHFIVAGTHSSHEVGQYAVDSLRQLSIKFLDKDEFVGFAFQERFLRPFELIVRYSPSPDVRSLCLMCTQNIVTTKAKNIKSGWDAVFDVVGASCSDPVYANMIAGFQLLLLAQRSSTAPVHLGAKCALKFASCQDQDTCLKALLLVEEFCSGNLFNSSTTLTTTPSEDTLLQERAKEILKLLSDFSATDSRALIRSRALKSIFEILRNGIYNGAPLDVIKFALIQLIFPSWHDARIQMGKTLVDEETFIKTNGNTKLTTLVQDPSKSLESTLAQGFVECSRLLLLMCGFEIAPNTSFGRTFHNSSYMGDLITNLDQEGNDNTSTNSTPPMAVVEEKVTIGGSASKEYRISAGKLALGELLDEVISLFKDVSCRNVSYLASIGIAALDHLLDLFMKRLDGKAWTSLLNVLEMILVHSLPPTAAGDCNNNNSIDDVGSIATQLNTCLGILKLLRRIIEFSLSSNNNNNQDGSSSVVVAGQVQKCIPRVLDLMERGFQSTSSFNNNGELRLELSNHGLRVCDAIVHEVMSAYVLLKYLRQNYDGARLDRVLGIILQRFVKQEQLANTSLLGKRLYKGGEEQQQQQHQDVVIYGDPVPGGVTFSTTFVPHANTSLERNLLSSTGTLKLDPIREINSLHPVVLFALRIILDFEPNSQQSIRVLKGITKTLLLDLIECDSFRVRVLVRKILEKHVVGG